MNPAVFNYCPSSVPEEKGPTSSWGGHDVLDRRHHHLRLVVRDEVPALLSGDDPSAHRFSLHLLQRVPGYDRSRNRIIWPKRPSHHPETLDDGTCATVEARTSSAQRSRRLLVIPTRPDLSHGAGTMG
jgi:hypothetical protein